MSFDSRYEHPNNLKSENPKLQKPASSKLALTYLEFQESLKMYLNDFQKWLRYLFKLNYGFFSFTLYFLRLLIPEYCDIRPMKMKCTTIKVYFVMT